MYNTYSTSNIMELTVCQQNAFDAFVEFVENDDPALTIKGAAGVGKTSLTKYIANYLMDVKHVKVASIAPTHKAKRVLAKILNCDRFISIPSMTVASILGKMREHSYIGSHKYTRGSKQKMDQYDYFILDEVSMVCDRDLEEIENYVCEHNKKLILIGDDCQIPAPSQPLQKVGDECYKPDSSAFDLVNTVELREVVRQVSDSFILSIAMYIRDNLEDEFNLRDVMDFLSIPHESMYMNLDEAYEMFVEKFVDGMSARMIAYTNAVVRIHNSRIRAHFGYEDLIVKGDLLTGYNNLGFPTLIIENGTDYFVANVSTVFNHRIGVYSGMVGMIVDLEDVDDVEHTSRGLFFIKVGHSSNATFLNELVKRAEKVNCRGSTKNDYKNYCSLKNSAVFLEDVYKYDGKVMTETDIKELHPLLFTNTQEVIDSTSKCVIKSKLTEKIEAKYSDILDRRLHDNKAIADGEVLADQYMVVEKDIYYGYAITAHKSQGSTYENVFVDEQDFQKIRDKWNYRFGCIERRTKEKNQLRYVAYTRASKNLYIV